jgi:hypothetical protein
VAGDAPKRQRRSPPAYKPKKALKSERGTRPIPSGLNRRQERLKKILIASRGIIDVQETAKELGVNRLTIWQDRRVITALSGPDQLEGWDEDAAIRRAIDFYESGMDVLISELQRVQGYECANQKTADRLAVDANLANLRMSIYNTLAIYRRDLSNFLIAIGLIREAPKRLILEDERIAKASTDEDIRAEIINIHGQLAALRARREAVAASSS